MGRQCWCMFCTVCWNRSTQDRFHKVGLSLYRACEETVFNICFLLYGWSKSCIVIGYPSRHDGPTVSCSLWIVRYFPRKNFPASRVISHVLNPLLTKLVRWRYIITCILLTKRAGRIGRISVPGLDSMDQEQRRPYRKDTGPIFSQYGSKQAWLIRALSLKIAVEIEP